MVISRPNKVVEAAGSVNPDTRTSSTEPFSNPPVEAKWPSLSSEAGAAFLHKHLNTLPIIGHCTDLEAWASLSMASWGRFSERALAAATAVLLQATLYLALSPRHPSLPGVANEPRLIAMILAATRVKRPPPPRVRASTKLLSIPVTEHPLVGPITPTEPQRQAARSPIDWEANLQREVHARESRADAPAKLRFGFPQMPASQGPHSPFGWNESHLNRVQRLAHGIIDIGENCHILLWFPIPQCDSDSDDGLFEHMHDPKQPEGPNTLP